MHRRGEVRVGGPGTAVADDDIAIVGIEVGHAHSAAANTSARHISVPMRSIFRSRLPCWRPYRAKARCEAMENHTSHRGCRVTKAEFVRKRNFDPRTRLSALFGPSASPPTGRGAGRPVGILRPGHHSRPLPVPDGRRKDKPVRAAIEPVTNSHRVATAASAHRDTRNSSRRGRRCALRQAQHWPGLRTLSRTPAPQSTSASGGAARPPCRPAAGKPPTCRRYRRRWRACTGSTNISGAGVDLGDLDGLAQLDDFPARCSSGRRRSSAARLAACSWRSRSASRQLMLGDAVTSSSIDEVLGELATPNSLAMSRSASVRCHWLVPFLFEG